MSLILNKGEDNEYSFPNDFIIEEDLLAKRAEVAAKVHQHGGVLVSDQKFDSRPMILIGQIFEDTPAEALAIWRAMLNALAGSSLKLYDGNDDYYWPISFVGAGRTAVKEDRVFDVEIELVLLEPFHLYKTETTDDEPIASSPKVYTVTNGGDIAVSPVITFSAGAGANISKIKIENATDADKYFEYEPASNLTSGDEVVIDCQDATCKLNTVDDIAHFVAGTFIELQSGDNSITVTITGTVGTNQLEFVFRERYL